MREYVVNARFVGMRITGVQRTAYEIVSRLLLNDQVHYNLVAPKLKSDVIATLPVKQQGRIRQGHLWEQLELPRIVRGAGRDAVLYSPMTSGPLAVTRQVMTVHDLFPLEHPEWFSRAFSTWYRWLLPRMIRRVVRIVVNSRYTRDQLLERYVFANDKVVLCPFAQSARFAPTSAEKVAQFRTDQGLPERYLLSLGSIQPRKNLATLAAAWRRTSASKQGIKLVLAGGVAPKRVLNVASTETNILEHPTIYHTGFFSDKHLPLLYQGADAFAFPSLAEGFGLPILEAMACGTPVICSNSTAMPETAGGAAHLVPPLDVEAWSEAIDYILFDSDVRQRMHDRGIKHAAQFSWSRAAKIVRSTLDSV